MMDEKYKLAKWLNNEMTDEELKEFKSDPDYSLYEKIKKYSSQLETPEFDSQKVLTNVIATKKATPKVIPLKSNWWMQIAAVLVIGLGLFFTIKNYATATEIAEYGEQTTFSLPDSSRVVLNSGSEIEYKNWNWKNNRNLNLKGEAYFKVAKGKKFEVNTNLGKVSVLGTQFNVKSRSSRFDVTCYEGRVKINYKNQEVIITKGQMVSFENNLKIIHQAITETKPIWTSKEINFLKENLSNIVEEIERQYNITIDGNFANSDQLFTGKVPSNNIDIALELIASSYHLKFKKTTNTTYTLEETK